MKIVDATPADLTSTRRRGPAPSVSRELTARQREVYDAAIQHGGLARAAKALGIDATSVRKAVERAEALGHPKVPRDPRGGARNRPRPTAASPATSATEEAMPGVRLPGGRVEGGPPELASSPPTEPPERRAAADHEREGFAPAPWTRPPARTVESIRSARTPRQYLGLDAKGAAPVAEAVRAPFGTAINAVDDEPATDEGTPLEQPATDPVSAEPALPPSAPAEPVASTPAPIALEVRARDVVSRRVALVADRLGVALQFEGASPAVVAQTVNAIELAMYGQRILPQVTTEAELSNLVEDHLALDWHEAKALVLALLPLLARSHNALRIVDAIVAEGRLP
jgi:hypothetical protein